MNGDGDFKPLSLRVVDYAPIDDSFTRTALSPTSGTQRTPDKELCMNEYVGTTSSGCFASEMR